MRDVLPWVVVIVGLLVLILRGRFRSYNIAPDDSLAGNRHSADITSGHVTSGVAGSNGDLRRHDQARRDRTEGSRMMMPIIISLAVLGSALYVILSQNYSDAQQKWAFGAVGTLLGHWLKGSK